MIPKKSEPLRELGQGGEGREHPFLTGQSEGVLASQKWTDSAEFPQAAAAGKGAQRAGAQD